MVNVMPSTLPNFRIYVGPALAEYIRRAASGYGGSASQYLKSLVEADINGGQKQAVRNSSNLEFLQIVSYATLQRDDPTLLDEILKTHRARMAGLSDAR